jgi:Protein of unknown function (DUF1553)/Protein of unknown function (DUF1549)
MRSYTRRLAGLIAVIGLAGLLAADEYDFPERQKNHWAWQPVQRPAPPRVKNKAWLKNPIDAFLLARMEAEGLTPAAPASREQLLRRVTFDLIGLPPTPEEIDAFLQDQSPNTWEKVIDRLLASPHYGERWGRHWLDLARFAESNGYEFDEVRPAAWRYRDYVIESFNQDKPYDRFIREQLAGDELYPDDPAARIATAFNLLGPDMTDSADQPQRRQNTLNDMTDTTALAFLGLTLTCCRCHDHKFEPLPQSDYYRFQAFFAPAVFKHDIPLGTKEQRAAYAAALREHNLLIQPTQDALSQLEEPYRKKLYDDKFAKLSDEAKAAHQTPEDQRTAAQKELVEKTSRQLHVTPQMIAQAMEAGDKAKQRELQQELKRLEAKKPVQPVTMGLQDDAKPIKTFVLVQGELKNRAEEVRPGFPIVLTPGCKERDAEIQAKGASTGRRSALANWIASKENPLTARVLVNRLWQHHFGRGLVATPSDFGLRGLLPTHPDLLDWLASEFVAQGWSVKKMHKLMLLSVAYQQGTKASPAAKEKDADNHLLSHMNRLRLEGEIVRDSLLAVSGRLNPKQGGPGVFPPVPGEANVTGWTASPDPNDHVRRSVYIFARRNLKFPFLEPFDPPDSTLSCARREQSTTAPQALALLNAPDVQAAAKGLAERVSKETTNEDERIMRVHRLALGRTPSVKEMELSRHFVKEASLVELCRALFNVNEFVYLD